MLRNSFPRAMLRSVTAQPCRRFLLRPMSGHSSSEIKRPQLALTPFKPSATSLRLYATVYPIDRKSEEAKGKQTLQADPGLVSATSSTHPIFSEVGTPETRDDTDMMAGIKSDLRTIKETFSMETVPREAYYIGMAGVLPYLGTSVATIYCAWEINQASMHGGLGFLMSGNTAELALHVLEPLQVGYGAVIISFLSAIHWGLEWAGYGGYQGYARYSIGVIGPAIAWPTTLLPVEYALIIQFLAFNWLYYADTKATRRGWAPAWYGVYRFVLTFIVGASIVASLIGRGQIADQINRMPSAADRVRALRESQMASLQQEEEEKRRRMIAKGEAEEDDEE